MKWISSNASGDKNQKYDIVIDFNVSEGKSKTPTCSEFINVNFSKYDKTIFNPFLNIKMI